VEVVELSAAGIETDESVAGIAEEAVQASDVPTVAMDEVASVEEPVAWPDETDVLRIVQGSRNIT
jgi:hypothetical protein